MEEHTHQYGRVHQGDTLGPVLVCTPVGTILRKLMAHFEPTGAEATAYMDEIIISCLDINPDTVQAVTFPKEELR